MVGPTPLMGQTAARRDQVKAALEEWHLSHDPAALAFLVSSYQGLAHSLAGRFARRGEEMDDLQQVALVGLIKAIERFEPERAVELSTFATATILGELKRHLRDRGWWVRPPRRVHDLYIRAQQAVEELAQSVGRSPTMTELARHLGVTMEEVEGRMSLRSLLARLPERDRTIIGLRFIAGWSQAQIGAFVGVTQMQVSRALSRSLAQLRLWYERELV